MADSWQESRLSCCRPGDSGTAVLAEFRKHEPVTSSGSDARATFEAKVQSLVGRRILAVDYWDIHNFSSEPARWDYGDWHHAVMGVQLSTDVGPVTATWTNTFHPYGVEVFDDPIERHLVLGETGPERVGPDGDSRWASFLDSPVRHATTWWDRLELGPATLLSTGEVVEPARAVDVPTAIRLDFRCRSCLVRGCRSPGAFHGGLCSSPATRSWWSSRPTR